MQIRTRTLVCSAAGLLAVGTATVFAAPTLLPLAQASAAAQAPAAAAADSSAGAIPAGVTPNYRAIVACNQAAVVGSMTSGIEPASAAQSSGPGDDPGDPMSQFFSHGMPMPRGRGALHGQGSGFIVSSDGLVLTNAHVVDGAQVVTVKLSDHREFKARVLGADRGSDIAVLKIDAHDLPSVRLGDSNRLAVGDYVLAIGEPFGLEETATAGIVSATGRSLPGDGYVPFIQTDAAVNPGNSGGPLFDANGAVIGINAQIYSNSGGYQGVSFAIPINVAVQIKDEIVKTGKVSHPRLGVEVQNVDQLLANSFRLKTPNGALVAQVEPDSAAARAGLQVGDVIVEFDGAPVLDAGQLSARVGTARPGQKVSLELWRDGKRVDVTATIGAAAPAARSAANGDAAQQGRRGLALRPLNPDERREAHVAAGGLLVEQAQGRAAEAGIQAGDVVLAVDGSEVQSVAQLRQMVQAHDKQIALLIQRGDTRLFVPVTLG